MGSHGTFVLQRLGSVAFKLSAAIDLYSVNCGRVAVNRSAGHAVEFENIGRNVIVVSKSGLVETGPTALVAMAMHNSQSLPPLLLMTQIMVCFP